jgi:hypothetical protein
MIKKIFSLGKPSKKLVEREVLGDEGATRGEMEVQLEDDSKKEKVGKWR